MADDSAKLNIEVRVEGAPKAANDLKVVDDGIASGKKVTDDLAKSLDTANIKIAELERRLEAARRSSLSEKKATDELSKSLDTANAKIAELERRLEAAGRNGLGGRFNADSQAARGLLSTLGGLAKMLGVISIAGAGSSGLVKAWKDAGEYRQLGLSLETIGGIAGYSKHQLDNLTLGLRSLDMTGQQARQSLLTLAQAEIDLGKATDLVRISRDAAALSGKTEQQVYNGLISAIQSGRAQTLRSLGLNVDFAASYQNLARQLGVTQKELNETQKSQARLNAVIESGKRVAGGYQARLS